MGRTLEDKKQIVAGLQENLSDTVMTIVIDYHGLTVAEITELRNQLRPAGAQCKITKNTLMRRAIKGDEKWEPLSDWLSDSSAFLLIKDDLGAAIKAYQAFQKATKKTELRGGVMDGQPLSKEDIKAIGDLPSQEVLMAQIAGAINSVAAKVAVGINEVPASLARALQAHADSDKAA
ncbi:50S ribosomal protein L10 [Acaryochloris sp. IP29b_bin.137]|uniref:50S ribosomal protein L10 n=1 Tax=Acaryochloris sp. IP29b_bin.137 TaxID=2969217 RepID=UPI0026260049|nr:50S ribosomal protein L10 [Acaryochloris sp. IP29b_bin.137]